MFAISETMISADLRNISPSGVGMIPLEERVKIRKPSDSSSALMLVLRLGWERKRFCAARLIEPQRLISQRVFQDLRIEI